MHTRFGRFQDFGTDMLNLASDFTGETAKLADAGLEQTTQLTRNMSLDLLYPGRR